MLLKDKKSPFWVLRKGTSDPSLVDFRQSTYDEYEKNKKNEKNFIIFFMN
jgi:hypothetical protein